uniref:Uncharacterized protein n=1 Tax=Anguilla anguilla TaxID=7936 RepID=A0A0E9PWY7_ANGAN
MGINEGRVRDWRKQKHQRRCASLLAGGLQAFLRSLFFPEFM